jgi:hypothetical protein
VVIIRNEAVLIGCETERHDVVDQGAQVDVKHLLPPYRQRHASASGLHTHRNAVKTLETYANPAPASCAPVAPAARQCAPVARQSRASRIHVVAEGRRKQANGATLQRLKRQRAQDMVESRGRSIHHAPGFGPGGRPADPCRAACAWRSRCSAPSPWSAPAAVDPRAVP